MKTIETTKELVLEQIEKDKAMKELIKKSHFVNLGDVSFYAERISQSENILKNGCGIFSTFKNEQVNVKIIEC